MLIAYLYCLQFEVTQAELASAKEAAHHAPSKTMKVLVDKLKQQLSTKESQHQVNSSKAQPYLL